ncbi:MAG: hypothetical protein ABIK38_04050 [candidate division WOR-3 bacterium]
MLFATEEESLYMVDIANPNQPQVVGVLRTRGVALAIAAQDSFAYIGTDDGVLQIISIADPANPQPVGLCELPDWGYSLTVREGYACIAAGEFGLAIIDISNPQKPEMVSHLPTPNWAVGVTLAGNYAYLTDADWLMLDVIDISSPEYPQEAGWYDYEMETTWGEPTAFTVATSNGCALLAAGEQGLRIVQFYGGPGVEEQTALSPGRQIAPGVTITRNLLYLRSTGPASLLDITGRKVMELLPGVNSIRELVPGIYFVWQESAANRAGKIVITR